MSRSNDEFAKQARELFDESVEQLDAATLSKLNRGRQAALAELETPRAGWVRWAPAAGVTAAVAIAVMISVRDPGIDETVPASVTDMEILLGEENIEMLEDLEFYSWIDLLEQANDVG